MKASVNTEIDTALTDIHLDHLLAADYDPASKPGVATALFNELVEDDAGVARYSANALEQAPSGAGESAAAIVAEMDANSTQLAALATAIVTFAESYAAQGVAPTLPQLLFELRALLAEKAISTTTVTTKRIDGSTTAGTYTLNSSTAPTSITRAT
jgi:hypothetical protein